jgi:hypothetical protein
MFENNTNKPENACTKKLETDEYRGKLDTIRSIIVSPCFMCRNKYWGLRDCNFNCCYKTWTLKEENGLESFENVVRCKMFSKREKVTGGWRKYPTVLG